MHFAYRDKENDDGDADDRRSNKVNESSSIRGVGLLDLSDSGDSDIWKPILGAYMSVSGESDSWAAVFGFCLSVSVESDKHAPVLGFVCPFLPNRTHADWGMVG